MKSFIRIALAVAACVTGVLAASTSAASALTDDPVFGPCVAPQRPAVVAGQETPICFPPRLPGTD